MDDNKLSQFASAACGAASETGAEQADVFVQSGRGFSLEIEKSSVRSAETTYDSGYCVRAFHKGGAGFRRGRGHDAADAADAGRSGAELSRVSEPDPDFKSLPEPAELTQVDALYDPAIDAFDAKDAIEWCKEAIAAAREISPDVIVKGGISSGASSSALVNSNGINLSTRKSFISSYVFSVVRKGDKVGSYYEYSQSRRRADLESPAETARKATRRALSFVDSRRMDTGKYPVVLGPLAATGFLRSVIGAACAEEVQRGRSYLAGKVGASIASPLIDVTEDPLCAAGVYSSSADGEGFPRKKRTLVKEGVLATYLHNSYTANKGGEKNTGHAARGSYSSSVGIGATNLIVKTGAETESEIIKRISDGLYIMMGSLSPNGVTGQVSGTVDFGFRIIDGELAYPVENVMLGGDVFDLLGAVEAVSSDYREEAGNVMPSILLGSAGIAGGA